MGDAVAGVSVALILIPQSIAYATIAGLPPAAGLFAATLPLIVAAPLVSCPWLQTGPTAMTSLLTLGALLSLGVTTPAQAIAAASLLAMIIGCTRLLLGICRLGSFTSLLTRPVVLGFTTGAAILIISSQLPKVLGISTLESNHVIRGGIESLQLFSSWLPEAIVIAIATAVFVLASRRIHRLFPGIFLAMIIAVIYSAIRQYEGPTVGALAGGFISLNLDLPWAQIGSLIVPGVIIAFVGFAEPASISITMMEEEGLQWNPSQELCAGGCANIVSGLIGGYPIGGSFSRTSVNKFAGADTSWSGLITGAVILSLLWLTPYLKALPQAAIAAVVIVAVTRLIKFREIWSEWKIDRVQGGLAALTLIATLVFAPRVDYGVAIGVVASLGIAAFGNAKTSEDDDDDA